jgi:hypothetical protein
VGNDGVNALDLFGMVTLRDLIENGGTWNEIKEMEMSNVLAEMILNYFDPNKISTYEEVEEDISEESWTIEDWKIVKKRSLRYGCECRNYCEEMGYSLEECIEYKRQFRNRMRAKLLLFQNFGTPYEKQRILVLGALAEIAYISTMAMPQIRTPIRGVSGVRSDPWRRTPENLYEKIAHQQAKAGMGRVEMRGLNDPMFKGMDKVHLSLKTHNGRVVVVHYVRDPKTMRIMDFKFKTPREGFEKCILKQK